MKEFTFTAYCTLGKCASGETYVDVELTEKEAKKLIKYGTDPDIYYNDFENCEELKDIYNKVYEIAIEQITDELRDTDWLDDKIKNDPNWRVRVAAIELIKDLDILEELLLNEKDLFVQEAIEVQIRKFNLTKNLRK